MFVEFDFAARSSRMQFPRVLNPLLDMCSALEASLGFLKRGCSSPTAAAALFEANKLLSSAFHDVAVGNGDSLRAHISEVMRMLDVCMAFTQKDNDQIAARWHAMRAMELYSSSHLM